MNSFVAKSGVCRASLLQANEIISFQKKFSEHKKHTLEMAQYAKILGDPTRCTIIALLFFFETLCVCDVANILEINIASASQHLRKLKKLEFLSLEKRRKTTFYALKKRSPFGLFCSKFFSF